VCVFCVGGLVLVFDRLSRERAVSRPLDVPCFLPSKKEDPRLWPPESPLVPDEVKSFQVGPMSRRFRIGSRDLSYPSVEAPKRGGD